MKNRRFIKPFFICLALVAMILLAAVAANAAPALSIPQEFQQPDGSTFIATLRGDEFFHFLEVQDGSVLTRDENGTWRYATADHFIGPMLQGVQPPVPELRATAAKYGSDRRPAGAMTLEQARWASAEATMFGNARRMELAAQSSEALAIQSIGEPREVPVLVILVDFDDVQIMYEDQWAQHVFGLGGKSVRDYYREATAGVIDIVPARETQGVVNDGVIRVHAGQAHPNTHSVEHELAKHIMQKTLGYVDYHSFDTNGDGNLDGDELNIIFVFAGYERATTGASPSVWARAAGWVDLIPGIIGGTPCSVIGERHWGGIMATIGVIAHELGHSMLGLRDLYGSNNLGGSAATFITLMGSGNWNTADGLPSGSVPARFDPYSLIRGRIVSPTIVYVGGSFDGSLRSLSTGNPDILKVIVDDSTHYLIDNRQYDGFDRYFLSELIEPGNHVYRYHHYDDRIWFDFYLRWVDSYANEASRKTVLDKSSNPSTFVPETDHIAWFTFEAKSPPGISMRVLVNRDGSLPTITGPTSLILRPGYAATSTGVYTLRGIPTPTVTKESGDARITWNDLEKRLDIAAGLAEGAYPVVLRASNGVGGGTPITFTLRIIQPPRFFSSGSTTVVHGTGGTFQVLTFAHSTGIITPLTYRLSGAVPAGVSINDRGLITIAASTAVGTHRFTVTVSDGVLPDVTQNFTLTVNPDKNALNALIVQARAIQSGNYSDTSWNALQVEIANAQAVFNDGNVTQAQLNTQYAALQAAINSLSFIRTIFTTRYEATLINWFLFFVAFGWIWMWF